MNSPTEHYSRLFVSLCRLLALITLLGLPACNSTLFVQPGAGGTDDASAAPTPESAVALRLVNTTDQAVETQVYVSSNGLADPEADLFTPRRLYTGSIGVAASGVLLPNATDTVTIPCSEGMVIGTAGGLFLDAEDGSEAGQGSPRIVQEGWVFDCQDRVTFVYRTVDGEFVADVLLE